MPNLASWPRNSSIPFHLTLTGSSPSDNLDLGSLALNFQLLQRIRVVAKGMIEDHHTIRHSSEDEAIAKGRDGRHAKGDFAVLITGDWLEPSIASNEGCEAQRIITGELQVGMLPSFINGGLSIRVSSAYPSIRATDWLFS
jgi:hypothetical protein